MSSNNNNTNSSSNNKPFCKVCKDAGCSESQYTSHFVKDQPGPNGKVVCPTLLNQSCRICNQTGHTSSYCKQYKPRPSREEPRHQEPRREEPRREEYRHQEPRREESRHQEYRREEPRDYRREEYRRDDYRREEPRHQEDRREEPRQDYRREEPRDYRRDDYRREEPRDYRRDDYRREEPRDYRREEPRHEDYRREEPRHQDYRREEPRHQETQRRAPYAHHHGPRVRLQLEAPALSAPAPAPSPLFDMPPWGTPEYWRMFQTDTSSSEPAKRAVIIGDEELSSLPITQIDVRKVNLKSEPVWDNEPLVSMDAEHRRILEDAFMASLISDEDFDFIVTADEDNMGGRRAINNGD